MLPTAIGNTDYERNITHLETLDDFTLMTILDVLPLKDLLTVSQLSSRFNKLIIDHYITKKFQLNTREIHIYVSNVISVHYKYDDNSVFSSIANLNKVFPTLEAIGHIFRKIYIRIIPEGFVHIERLQCLINKYCSNAFQTIELSQYGIYKLAGVNVSFLNASNVILHHNHFQDIPPLRLDVAFPRMQRLYVDRDTELKQHNPNLIELVFNRLWQIRSQADLLRFVRINPQLRSIEVPCLDNAEFLSALGESSPNLESLSIRFLHTRYNINTLPSARFKNVKRFTLEKDMHDYVHLSNVTVRIVDSIQFDSLESFSVLAQTSESIIEVILKNAGLRHVMINSEFSPAKVSSLFTSLTELKEISIMWIDGPWNNNRLVEYLEHANRSNTLESCTVSFADKSRFSNTNILPHVPRGWAAMVKPNSTSLYLRRSTFT